MSERVFNSLKVSGSACVSVLFAEEEEEEEEEALLPRHLGGCCTRSTYKLALEMRFRVQLLLKRGAPTPSSQKKSWEI